MEITAHICGPSTDKCRCQCPDGPCEHKWDGPTVKWGDNCYTSTCSRCQMPAVEHSMWVAP